MNRPDAITVLVKPNLLWLVRGHDGWSCTFVLPIGFDRLLVIAASLPVASLHQIYRDAPMYPASPIEGHSLQWGHGCLRPISQVGNCVQHQKGSYQDCLSCHASPMLPWFRVNGSHRFCLGILPLLLIQVSQIVEAESGVGMLSS